MNDNYNFKLIGGKERAFGGYVSARDKTALAPNFMVRGSKNVYLKRTGTIANRPGLLRRGSADSTAAGIKSSFEWDTSLGKTYPLRVADGKLQFESDIIESGAYVWYTLLDSISTAEQRMIFDTWWDNTAKKDKLIFCNGTSSLQTWSGGVGLIASTTSNTVVLTADAAGLGFESTGTIIINGTSYTYSGITTVTLTGVSADPTGEADGSVVIQRPNTDATTPASGFSTNFLKVIGNQLYCGSDSSRLVYISKNDDYTDFTAASPRVIGDAEILTLDGIPTGIGERDGNAHISTKDGWYIISFNQITVGSALTEQTLVEKVPLSALKGALRHEFIGNVGNDLIYLSQDQQLHVFGTFRNISQPQFPTLSADIETELYNEDFTGGHLRTAGDMIYLTAPNNGRVWLHETQTVVTNSGNIDKKRVWHAPFIWNLARIAVIGGIEYGHSNANPQMYQMWGTLQWHDDSPSGESLPYDSLAVFSYRGKPAKKLITDKLYTEGYYAPGSIIGSAVAFEYQGERSVQQGVINDLNKSPESYTGDVGISLGEATLGDNPLGFATSDEEADQDMLPKFRVVNELGELNVFECQPRVFSSEPGDRWEILYIGMNEQDADEKVNELKR